MSSKNYLIACAMLTGVFASAASSANEASPRIVGGQNATFSEAPWQAAVTVRRTDGTSFCGGVVIGNRWILTAAHCLNVAERGNPYLLAPASAVSVFTGTSEVYGADFANYQSSVAATFAHKDYNESNFLNDIALIQLSQDVNINAVAIQLSDTSDQSVLDNNADNNNRDLLLTGWGNTNTLSTQTTDILQKATFSAVSDLTCANEWQAQTQLDLSTIAGYENSYLCARESGATVCNGDSGGPLVWDDNGTSKLVGLVSFGVATKTEKCPIDLLPDVFTQVSNYSDWIANCQSGNCYSFVPVISNSGGGGGSIGWLSLLFTGMIATRRRLPFL